MNEMCDDIRFRAFQKLGADHISNFKKMSKNEKFKILLFLTNNMKNSGMTKILKNINLKFSKLALANRGSYPQ